MQTLAERTIANLVVVLYRVHKLPGGSIARRRATRLFEAAPRCALTLVQPALLDAPGHFRERAGIVGVVALVVAGQVAPQTVMEVVRPHGIEPKAAVVDRPQVAHIVLMGLGHQGHLALGRK